MEKVIKKCTLGGVEWRLHADGKITAKIDSPGKVPRFARAREWKYDDEGHLIWRPTFYDPKEEMFFISRDGYVPNEVLKKFGVYMEFR